MNRALQVVTLAMQASINQQVKDMRKFAEAPAGEDVAWLEREIEDRQVAMAELQAAIEKLTS